MQYTLRDLIDADQFQSLMTKLNAIHPFPSALIDTDGHILAATAWQDICTKFHRVHPDCQRECQESDQYIACHLHEADPAVSYRCPHGLIDTAMPILIDGVHYGSVFIGQFFLEPPDPAFFRRQAQRFGFDEEAYLAAVNRVPIWTKEHLRLCQAFIKELVDVLSGMGLQKLRAMEAADEHAQLQSRLFQAQKMESIGRLAGGVAHDFSNMLQAIVGYAEFLQADPTLTAQQKSELEEILKASDRATTLTRQLLAFSRKSIISPRVLNLNEVLDNVQSMLERLLGEDIFLECFRAAPVGSVKVDPGQIEQMILNLAVNARDAMPDGGRLVIETGDVILGDEYCATHQEVTPGAYVMLAVSDTGTGMQPEIKAKIFEPFFTTKDKEKGTGLGLAMVYGAVKQNGGSIEVYSEEGRGTTIKLYFPRVSLPSAPQVTPAMPALAHGHETVLLVEDEEIVRDLAIVILQRLGYTVLAAANGDDALRIAQAHTEPIHLLFTDVVLRGMNGRQVAERLAAIHPEARVLYASGYTENVIAHHGILEDGLAFLNKPYSLHILSAKIREILG